MDKQIAIKHIMSRNLVTVRPNELLENVQQKLTTHNIHHAPVVEGTQIVGIVSQSDLFRMEHQMSVFKTDQAVEQNKAIFSTMLAQDIMIKEIVMLNENDTASDAVRIFKENLFHALPVINGQGELIGMVTPLDLITYAFDDHPAV